MKDNLWHIAQDGKQEGPYSIEEILTRIRDSRLTSDAYVFKIGTHEWLPITERGEFANEFDKIPPPPPPNAVPKKAAAPEQDISSKRGGPHDPKTRKTKKTGKVFRRFVGRILLAGVIGYGVFVVSDGSVQAAGIAAVLGLMLGASPVGWLSIALASVGLYIAYESYDPKPYCLYVSEPNNISSIKEFRGDLCYTTFPQCSDAIQFHQEGFRNRGGYLSCWDSCRNMSDFDCKVRTLIEGHRPR